MSDHINIKWIQGLGDAEVITDFLYQSVRWKVEVNGSASSYDSYTDGIGLWPVLVAAGTQKDGNFLMGITTTAENTQVPLYSGWFLNGIYNKGSDPLCQWKDDTGDISYTYSQVKQSDDYNITTDVIACYMGQEFTQNNPGWTTASSVGPKKLTFFCTKDPTTGETFQHSTNARLNWCKIYDYDGNTVLAYFTPVKYKDIVCLYDNINDRYYPITGNFRYNLNNSILEGYQDRDIEISVSNKHSRQIFIQSPCDYVLKSFFNVDKLTVEGIDQIYVGKTLSVSNESTTSFSQIKWFRGTCLGVFDSTPIQTGKNYTIQDLDLEKFLKVSVQDKFGNVIEKTFFVSSVPVVYLDVEGDREIPTYGDAPVKIRIQGNSTFQQQYEGKAEIHLRGDSSAEYETQKPYKLKLKKKTNLFGFGSNRHWVLVSNYIDNSLLRNKIATEFAEHLSVPYSKMQHIVLVLNGTCLGVYMLAQHVRINETRVDIHNWEDESEIRGYTQDNLTWVDEDDSIDVSGGYLYELDEGYDETTQFKTSLGTKVMIRKPEFAFTSQRMMDYSRDIWKKIQNPLRSIYYRKDQDDVFSNMDVQSFARFLVIGMVAENIDMATRSIFCYKDKNQKMKFGPIWDFDLAFDSAVWSSEYPYDVWGIFRNTNQCFYNDALSLPYICHEIKNAFETLRPKIVEIISDMDSRISELQNLGLMNDTTRRSNSYSPSWKNGETITLRGYTQDCQNLKSFLQNRLDWLDSKFTNLNTLVRSLANDYQKNKYAMRYLYIHFIVDGTDYSWSKSPDVPYSTVNQNIYFTFKQTDTENWNVKFLANGKQIGSIEDKNVQCQVSILYTDELKQNEKLVLEAIVERSPNASNYEYNKFFRSFIVLNRNSDPVPLSLCDAQWYQDIDNGITYPLSPYIVLNRLTYNGMTLTENLDYTVQILPDINSYGQLTCVVTGIGNYTGTVEKVFEYKRQEIIEGFISGINEKYQYTGNEITPELSVRNDKNSVLIKGIDYTVQYSNNIEDGIASVEITGIGNYQGTVVKTFTIYKPNLESEDICTILGIPTMEEYTGEPIIPEISVTFNSEILQENVDYQISISDNVNVGTATVTISGIGSYLGTVIKTFQITQFDGTTMILDITDSTGKDFGIYSGTMKTGTSSYNIDWGD